MRFTLKRKRKFELILEENIMYKDSILEEYKKIRHEYNNMLQGVICFIEEEDWEGLKTYKNDLLEKTKILNENNFTQLVKLKNKNILSLIYKLLIRGKASGITINLRIYKDIENMKFCKSKVYKALEQYLNYAYEVSYLAGGPVNLKISGNSEGMCFAFENTYDERSYSSMSELIKNKKKINIETIFYNTLIEAHKLRQEILISTAI